MGSLFKQSKNIGWLLALSAVIAISQFVVYRYVYLFCGEKSMGVWALFAAVGAMVQITSFGFAPALVRLVPTQEITRKKRNTSLLLATVNASNLLITFPLTLALYLPAIWYGQSLLSGIDLENFEAILPAGIIGLCLHNFSSAYLFLLDGHSLFYKRAIIQIAGNVLFVALVVVGIQFYGLIGVSYAFLAQNTFIAVCSIIVAGKLLPVRHLLPIRFNKWAIRQLFGFSFKMQIISLLVIFFDPLVKYFITNGVGLAATASYEIANKAVVQLRNMLAVSNQTIVPTVVKKNADGSLHQYYKGVFEANQLVAFSISLLLIGCAPFISFFFTRAINLEVIIAMLIMNVAWYVNMVSVPAYYLFLGINKLNVLIMVHLIIAVIAVICFALFSMKFIPGAYAIAPCTAIVFGALFNISAASRYAKLGIFSNPNWLYLTLLLIALSATLIVAPQIFRVSFMVSGTIVMAIAVFVIGWLFFSGKLEGIKKYISL